MTQRNNVPDAGDPIFILGILPRCGTNFLYDLLKLHPDCGTAEGVWEDYFLFHTNRLEAFLDGAATHWDSSYASDPAVCKQIRALIGRGLVDFLKSNAPDRRIVTKTPRVDHLHAFFTFFPEARLLILVRDGRSVIESGVKTFGWHREWAVREWARAAGTILAFEAVAAEQGFSDRYLIVRYEDLWQTLEETLRRILAHLDLDPADYDFQAAANLPIRGSSTGDATGAIHWNPVQKTAAFDPMSRWRHWSQGRHERFNWLAGEPMRKLGYEPRVFPGAGGFWKTWNRLLDLRWGVLLRLRPILAPLWRQKTALHRRRRQRPARTKQQGR